MRRLSPGNGYRYLLKSVAAGDGNRSLASPLTRYYAEAGTPPGRWMGGGLGELGAGQLRSGDPVHESQLALLIGLGRDPITGDPLGRAYPDYRPGDDADARRSAVAGFDFTFSVPKSVSVLWGVADAGLQRSIFDAHHAAVAEVVDYLEREVAATRAGVAAGDGAVAQVGVPGVIAAAFDHWDSRSGDPQLHTHVVISNKVRTLLDGRWRSLDSRPVHAAVTAISAHYNAVLADRLSAAIGVAWEARDRGPDRNLQWEIAGVGEEMIAEFSSRTRDIELEKERLIQQYVDRHGRSPSNSTIVELRAQATLATRPEKTVRSLADLTGEWRRRATALLGKESAGWAWSIVAGASSETVDVDAVPPDLLSVVADRVVMEVSTKRSTWKHWNLWAAASKETMGWRFATIHEREAVVGMIVEAAEQRSIALTPPELAVSPVDFRRDDGTSVFRPRHATVFSSAEVLRCEDRLLALADDRLAVTIADEEVRRGARGAVVRGELSAEQLDAVASVADSGRRLDLLVGPAGAGKTTALRALTKAWTTAHGAGSVVGLAPSAAAAKVLGEELALPCENTAKWLHDLERGRAAFQAGQLVIVDEATLASTRALDQLATLAAAAGAKTLLVGDPAQLQSVDAGGAFAMLVAARADVAELTDLHRFIHRWEKAATLNLRAGRTEVIDVYDRHDRLREGTTEQMIDAAYAAWRQDGEAGRQTILVTESIRTVRELNARARAERVLASRAEHGDEAQLAEGARASAGDIVITRRNERWLRDRMGEWVRNGDRWVVTAARADGSMTVRRLSHRRCVEVVLPPAYVAQYVDLGYAVTAHRAQGVTVDTAHVVVSSRTTRENLYVSMTRGRSSNIAYVALDEPDDNHTIPEAGDANAGTVLRGVLAHSGVELSATQAIAAEQDAWSSIARLAAEYETLAAAAQRERWIEAVHRSGLSEALATTVVRFPSFGPLCAVLRRAEAFGHDAEEQLRRAVARRSLADAVDVAAVLHKRLEIAVEGRGSGRVSLVAGLIPAVHGQMPPEYEQALSQRADLIETRAEALAEEAVRRRAPWIRRLGEPPAGTRARLQWMRGLATVAAYRDRYGIDGPLPVGSASGTRAQAADRHLARLAARRAVALSSQACGATPTPQACRTLA